MPRNFGWIVVIVFLLLCAGFLLNLNGCGSNSNSYSNSHSSSSLHTSNKIQHVIVIFQENRTPDNLFHGLPNADIANSGTNSHGQVIPLTPVPLANAYDLSHRHSAFVNMYDGGKMD